MPRLRQVFDLVPHMPLVSPETKPRLNPECFRHANYRAVVPTTWNAGRATKTAHTGLTKPRSSAIPSPMRNARSRFYAPYISFDPCLACAIHTFDPEGKELIRVS